LIPTKGQEFLNSYTGGVAMADTRVQTEVETWIRSNWMPKQFVQEFTRKSMILASGGKYSFDAVSEDNRVVAVISTSGARTSSGKSGVGKMLKIRSDIYFLLLVDAESRVVILTEQDMFELCQKEKENGRVPQTVEFLHAVIPDDLEEKLKESRRRAANEVSPK